MGRKGLVLLVNLYMLRYVRLALFCMMLPLLAKAAQAGGEIIYTDLGGGNYRITLKLYRDCINNPAPFDNPAIISIYDANGTFVDSLSIPFTTSSAVPPAINNPCFTPPASVCVDVAIYSAVINLPPKAGGYSLVYQRCCRSASILNISNPGSTGASYMEHIPGPEVVTSNNSPHFNVSPPTFLCSGVAIDYNVSASDPDGDSLVYEFCSPLVGLDPCCPALVAGPPNTGASGCVNPPTTCPGTGSAPPYSNVSYVSPYSGSFPLSSNPSIQIDPRSGHITGTANITGQWVVAICVMEYRNGFLIGTHSCDFQFNVVNCPNLIQSSILPQPQNQQCNGLTVTFTNLSSGGTGYSWNFGDPSTLSDTSNAQTPTYTFADSGRYVITLINHGPSPACNDTSTQVYYVYPALNPTFTPPPSQCVTANSYSFTAGGQFASYSVFFWNFSSSATPATSTQQNPSGITYSQPGAFPVTLTVKEKNCQKAYTDTVRVYPSTAASFVIDTAKGCQPLAVTFTNTSVYGGGTSFTWYFGDGSSAVAFSPTHVYPDTGTFNITLVASTTVGCISTSSVTVNGLVTVFPGPKPGFTAKPTHTDIFNPKITFTDTSSNITQQVVVMGDGTSFNSLPSSYTYSGYGTFVVMQIALSSNGCSDTARQTIIIDPDFTFYVPNSFSPNQDIHNEEFHVYSFAITDYSISIYDRWGKEVFSSTDPEKGWDGNYKGKKCEQDIYVYKIEFTPLTDPYPRKLSGVIHLIR
jgi:gliding motility-associated-like protein